MKKLYVCTQCGCTTFSEQENGPEVCDNCGSVDCFDEMPDDGDEPWDGFNSDAEADADVLASAGWGTDEDYGYYGE